MFLLSCRRKKAQLLAFCYTAKVWPSTHRTTIWYSRKRLHFDYNSLSDIVAPKECDCCSHCSHKKSSKFNKTTGLHIFASSSMIQSCCNSSMT